MFSGAVRRNRILANPSNAEIEDAIKLWLRQSCDGDGGRQWRELRKTSSSKRVLKLTPRKKKVVRVSLSPVTDVEPSD